LQLLHSSSKTRVMEQGLGDFAAAVQDRAMIAAAEAAPE